MGAGHQCPFTRTRLYPRAVRLRLERRSRRRRANKKVHASVLGATSGHGTGGSLYVGVGPPGKDTKNNSAGLKIGYSQSCSEGVVALVDVNGDGLPDRVCEKNGTYITSSMSPGRMVNPPSVRVTPKGWPLGRP